MSWLSSCDHICGDFFLCSAHTKEKPVFGQHSLDFYAAQTLFLYRCHIHLSTGFYLPIHVYLFPSDSVVLLRSVVFISFSVDKNKSMFRHRDKIALVLLLLCAIATESKQRKENRKIKTQPNWQCLCRTSKNSNHVFRLFLYRIRIYWPL